MVGNSLARWLTGWEDVDGTGGRLVRGARFLGRVRDLPVPSCHTDNVVRLDGARWEILRRILGCDRMD